MRLHKFTKKCFKSGGRNNQGVTTVFHRGGGNKRLLRIVDLKRSLFDTLGVVEKLEYDPNRTAKMALIRYKTGILTYILAPRNLVPGNLICAGFGDNVEISLGNALPIGQMPVGTLVHNLELKPGRGGQLMRAAGTYAKIIKKEKSSTLLRLHSGKYYNLSSQSMGTIGMVSNENHKNIRLRKAGQSRWKGIRPTVRGVAMNPIDHPHGGGEGRSKGGRHPVSP